MAQYDITSPDGAVYQITAPDDATQDQVMAYAQQQHANQPKTSTQQYLADKPELASDLQKLSGNNAGAGYAFGEGLANAVPFGQRITSALGATGAALAGAGNIGDLYNQSQADTAATASANPKSAFAGTLTGIAPTLALGGGMAKWASAPAVGGSGFLANTANTIGQSVKGAITAAPIGAAYAAGNAKTVQDMPAAALHGGEVSGAIGAALPLALGAASGAVSMGKGIMARGGDELEDAGKQMYQNASGNYQKMRDIGAQMSGESATNLSNSINDAVKDTDVVPELYPKTAAVIQRINDKAADGSLSLNHLDQYRRILNKASGSEDAFTAGAVRDAIDAHVNSLTGNDLTNGSTEAVSALNDARQSFQQASKFDDISTIVKNAGGDPNKIKAGLTRFMNNKDNLKGWSDSEIQSLQNAASGTTSEKVLKMLGKFGFDLGTSTTMGNTVAPVAGAGMAGLHSGGVGLIAAPVIGTAARQGQKWLARGKAEQLLQTLQAPPLSSIIP